MANPGVTVFKTTGLLQGQLSLSIFWGRSNEYRNFWGLCGKCGSVAMRKLDPIHKKGPQNLKLFKDIISFQELFISLKCHKFGQSYQWFSTVWYLVVKKRPFQSVNQSINQSISQSMHLNEKLELYNLQIYINTFCFFMVHLG